MSGGWWQRAEDGVLILMDARSGRILSETAEALPRPFPGSHSELALAERPTAQPGTQELSRSMKPFSHAPVPPSELMPSRGLHRRTLRLDHAGDSEEDAFLDARTIFDLYDLESGERLSRWEVSKVRHDP